MQTSFDTAVTSASPRPIDLIDAAVAPRGPRVWAGALLLLAGLALILLAGCFLIGTLTLIRPDLVQPGLQVDQDSAAVLFTLIVLFLIAAFCLVGAAVLFVLGVKGLLRIMNE